jgi:hypothetical protein
VDPRKLIRRLPDIAGTIRERTEVRPVGDRRVALLDTIVPGTKITETNSVAFVERADGLSVTLSLEPAGGTVLSRPMRLPAVAALLPAGPFTLQLVVHSQPPPGDNPLSASYLELTRYNCARNRWAYLTLTSTAGEQAGLLAAAEALRERLAAEGIAAEPVDAAGVLAAVALVGHLDDGLLAAGTALVRRGLGSFDIGQTTQSCFTWQDPTGHVLGRLCLLPATAATVGVAVAAAGGELVSEQVLRLAAPNKAILAHAQARAAAEVVRLGARLDPLDGKHLPAAAVTFPVGAVPSRRAAAGWARVGPAHALAAEQPWCGGAGLLLGWDAHHGTPVPARLFRHRPTTGVVLGHGLAKLIALRAVAAGAAVTVQTTQPQLWRGPFQLLPPGVPVAPSGGPHRPHLIVGEEPATAAPGAYQAHLTALDTLVPQHLPLVEAVDLVVFGEVDSAQRALLNATFGGVVGPFEPHPGHAVAISRDQLSAYSVSATPVEQSMLA